MQTSGWSCSFTDACSAARGGASPIFSIRKPRSVSLDIGLNLALMLPRERDRDFDGADQFLMIVRVNPGGRRTVGSLKRRCRAAGRRIRIRCRRLRRLHFGRGAGEGPAKVL